MKKRNEPLATEPYNTARKFDGIDIDAIHHKIKAVLITNIKNKTPKAKPQHDDSIENLIKLAESVGLNVQIEVVDTDFDDDGRC